MKYFNYFTKNFPKISLWKSTPVKLFSASEFSLHSTCCVSTLAIDSTWVHALRVCPQSDALWALTSDGIVKNFDLRRLIGGQPLPSPELVSLEGSAAAATNHASSISSISSFNAMAGFHTCFDMHLGGQIVAVGRSTQIVSVHSLRSGKTVNNIKYHEGILGQRIGSPIAVAFHPYKVR